MKIIFDLFPVFMFYAVFKWAEGHAAAALNFMQTYFGSLISGGAITLQQAPIILATTVTVAAAATQIGTLLIRRKKIDGMLWASFLIITILGGLTIYFHNENFIKWKPTMLYWCLAGALLFSQLVMKKNLTRSIMKQLEEEMNIPETVWTRLNLVWILFYVGMGFLNLLVAFNFSNAVWVNFKLGSMGIVFVFLLVQLIYLSRFGKPSEESS